MYLMRIKPAQFMQVQFGLEARIEGIFELAETRDSRRDSLATAYLAVIEGLPFEPRHKVCGIEHQLSLKRDYLYLVVKEFDLESPALHHVHNL